MEEIVRECKYCKKIFNTKYKDKIFCSSTCQKENYKEIKRGTYISKERQEKKCPYCNKVFKPRTGSQRYCTKECTQKAYAEKQKRIPSNKKKLCLTINEVMRIGREHGIYNNYGKIVGMIERGEIRI